MHIKSLYKGLKVGSPWHWVSNLRTFHLQSERMTTNTMPLICNTKGSKNGNNSNFFFKLTWCEVFSIRSKSMPHARHCRVCLLVLSLFLSIQSGVHKVSVTFVYNKKNSSKENRQKIHLSLQQRQQQLLALQVSNDDNMMALETVGVGNTPPHSVLCCPVCSVLSIFTMQRADLNIQYWCYCCKCHWRLYTMRFFFQYVIT